MTRDEIEKMVKEICKETLQIKDEDVIVPDANFSYDLGGDSLDFMGVMLEIEDRLEISFGNEITGINSGEFTIKDIVDLTEKTLSNVQEQE